MEALQLLKSAILFVKYVVSGILEADLMEIIEFLLAVIAFCLLLYLLRIMVYAFVAFIIIALS